MSRFFKRRFTTGWTLLPKIIFLSALIFYIQHASAQSDWYWQNPLPTGNTLYGVHFTDSITGTAVGVNGTILRTTNSGTDWIPQSSGTTNTLYGVHFTDSITGTAVGAYGRILRTTNGGSNWMPQSSGTTNTLRSVYFTNAYIGTVVGGGGTILRTINGGVSWNFQSCDICGSENEFRCVSFIDADNGMTVASDLWNGNGRIYRTTNGGAVWVQVSGSWSLGLDAISFTDINTITAVGRRGYKLLTTDGGANWAPQGASWAQGDLYSVSFNDVKNGTTVGEGGIILRTKDSGANWIAQTNGSMNIIHGVHFTDANIGVAVGGGSGFCEEGGIILRTTNGGSNWINQTIGTENWLYSVYFTDADSGTVVGWGGKIFRTTNGGAYWMEQTVKTINGALMSVCFPDSVTGIAVGQEWLDPPGAHYAIILRTTNGGLTWTDQSNGMAGALLSVFFTDVNTGTAVGLDDHSPFLVHTTNGGESWTKQSIDDVLTCISFSDASTGTAVGYHGNIIRTTDGGASWIKQSSGITRNLKCVYFINANRGIVVGDSGTIIRTTNGGSSWISQASGTTNNLLAVYFTDTDSGTVVGQYGTILRTTNGGAAWPNEISGTVFHDIDWNDVLDGSDSTISGLKILLKDLTGAVVDSQLTDSLGKYKFFGLNPGVYTVSEIPGSDWFQTMPSNLGSYTLSITYTQIITGKDFYNTHTYRYTGPPTGNWSDSANWTGGAPPGSDKFVSIPGTVVVTVDSLPQDTVKAIRVESGGKLQFSYKVNKLNILRTLQIDKSATIEFPVESDTTGVICYKDWVNRGTLDPGHSVVRFTGDQPKVIASDGGANSFYKIEITGDSTSVIGNVTVKNQLLLTKGLVTREQDSIIVENNDTSAISDTGIVTRGTIKRKIKLGETGTYRFESPDTYLRFSGEGTNPSAVAITIIRNKIPGYFLWDSVGGVVDTIKNIIKADNIRDFSKWVFGIPRPKIATSSADSFLVRMYPINRLYVIQPEYGENYSAQLSLRYDQDDVTGITAESELKLMRGPYYTGSVQSQWNIVSLPLIPKNSTAESVFTNSSSAAFAYEGTYIEKTYLKFGEGYWLKFPFAHEVLFKGDDVESVIIDVKAGWNLIGSISYPVDVSSILSFPPNIITSSFFGYTKSYDLVDSLQPMFGYWVKVSSDGQLILSNSGSGMFLKMASEKSCLTNFNSLVISDANGAEQRLYFGKTSNVDQNRYELPPLPPEGIFDARYASGRLLEVPDKHNNREIPILLSSATYPIRLRWELVDDGGTYALKIGEKCMELKINESLIIDNPEIQISLHFDSHSVTEISKEFQLSQNYPNPFNSSAIIKYKLPMECRVNLKIYNILGQRVSTLVDEIQKEGDHSAVEIATDLPSGVYFYRLEATSASDPSKTFTQVKKMLLVK